MILKESRITVSVLSIVIILSFAGCTARATYQPDKTLPDETRQTIDKDYGKHGHPQFQLDKMSQSLVVTKKPDTFWGSGNTGNFPVGEVFSAYLDQVSQGDGTSCSKRGQTVHAQIKHAGLHYKYAPSSWLVPFSGIKIGWIEVTLETENRLDNSSEVFPLKVKSSYDTPASDIWTYMPREQPIRMVLADLMLVYLGSINDHYKSELAHC